MTAAPWALSPHKRTIDVVLAGFALLVLSPVLLLTAFAVWVSLGAPVLFRQRRIGLKGAEFDILKFRSMRDLQDIAGRPLDDAQRLTRFGRWLRASSLDELPELLNVVRGDMSLVGPRPLLPEYLSLYSTEQARRHDVRPGLTGLAQVNGRNAVSWADRFRYDVWYVEQASIYLDLRIIARTVIAVVSRKGIAGNSSPTMTPFRGER
jgi:sugar transferase EpsL